MCICGTLAYHLHKDHSKRWLVQKLKFLHLALSPFKTWKNGSKSGAKVWFKTPGAEPTHIFGFCNSGRVMFFSVFSIVARALP
jgi:hypothetical protein